EAPRRAPPVRVTADSSYRARRMRGDRWVAVGDAAAFLDPIFSTGVLLALQGGVEAAAAIDAGLRAGDLSVPRCQRSARPARVRSLRAALRALGADGAAAVSLLPPVRGGLLRSLLPPAAVPAVPPVRHLRGGALRAGRQLATRPRHPPAHPAVLRHRGGEALPADRPARRRGVAAPGRHPHVRGGAAGSSLIGK